jgi:hypothetical protein
MDEDRPEDSSPDSGRAKRPPPTIDLEASEVSGQNQDGGGEAKTRSWDFPRSSSWPFRPSWVRAISASLVAAATSAVTAAIVVAFAWVVGWPGEPPPQPANPQTNTSAIDMLGSRVSDLEERSARPAQAVPDPALQGQIEALGKSVASLRNEMAGIRAQSEKLAAELNAVRSAPREAASPDLATIKERLSELERAKQAESTEIAQAANKPVDDKALRRVVAASMLDVSVRQGEPFVAALAAAKALAPDPEALKALDVFAATGVPNAASLCRELLTLVPKLSPPAPQNSTTGTGIMDRLQAGAAKLVRIERTDAVGNDRSAVVARVTAAALRNDLADARRELNSLAPADRAAAQDWLDKAREREAALASSRQFASEAMAALAKPAQPNTSAQPNTPAQQDKPAQ